MKKTIFYHPRIDKAMPYLNRPRTDKALPYLNSHQYINRSGFTLVELIIVISIIAILGTIGFVSYSGYTSSARDSARVSDLGNIRVGLDLYNTQKSTYPSPDSPVEIKASGALIGYQGYIGTSVQNLIRLDGDVKDPVDNEYYTYSTNSNKNKYQILGFLENNEEAFNNNYNIINKAYAADYSSRFPTTKGDQLGILLQSGTLIPIQTTGTGVDVVSTTGSYVAYFTDKDSISGTGNVLAVASNMGAKSCNDLLIKDPSKKNKDGVYYINPTMSSSNSGTFQVYCDMTTDLGGWTLVLHTDNIQINTYGSSLNKPIYKPDSYYDDKFLLVSPIKSIRFSCKINKASNSWDIDKIFENDSLTKINGVWSYLTVNHIINENKTISSSFSVGGWNVKNNNGTIEYSNVNISINDGFRGGASDNDFWFAIPGNTFYGGFIDGYSRLCAKTTNYGINNAPNGAWAIWTK